MMSIDSSGSSDLRTMFNRGRQSVQSKNLELATKSGADIVLNEVRTTKNKGGRTPYITGDYRRSFDKETVSRGLSHCVVRVGTNAPQGKRLEFGFVGRDVLGRYYNQAAQPHLRPALDENVDEVREEIRAAMRQLVLREVQ